MSWLRRREIPWVVTIVVLIITVVDRFFTGFETLAVEVKSLAVIIAAFAEFLGIAVLFIFHGRQIKRRTKGRWYFSVWMIIVLVITTAYNLVGPDWAEAKWILEIVYMPLAKAIYALLGFYIISAAYRAFRARSVEAALLLIVGSILILSNTPVIAAYIPDIVPLAGWFKDVPNTAGQRAIYIGAGIGVILYVIRLLMGTERAYLPIGREER